MAAAGTSATRSGPREPSNHSVVSLAAGVTVETVQRRFVALRCTNVGSDRLAELSRRIAPTAQRRAGCGREVREEWSARSGSNRRHSAWEADALPTELRALASAAGGKVDLPRGGVKPARGPALAARHAPRSSPARVSLASAPVPREAPRVARRSARIRRPRRTGYDRPLSSMRLEGRR